MTSTATLDAPRAEEDALRTEFAFELPRGYVDDDGVVHRAGSHAARHREGRDPAAARPARP